jgi:hypothetical protein
MVPVVAVLGTTALTVELSTGLKEKAGIPLKETALAPVRLVPVSTTALPGLPCVGLTALTVGTGGGGGGEPPPLLQAVSASSPKNARNRIGERFMAAPGTVSL